MSASRTGTAVSVASTAWSALAFRRRRVQLYAALGAASFLLALLAQIARPHGALTFTTWDAKGYYAYLPAVYIDHSLDLRSQLAPRAPDDVTWDETTPLGYLDDQYPIGVSVTLVPEFALADALTRAVNAIGGHTLLEPDGFTLLYQLLALAFVIGLAVFTIFLADHVAVRGLGLDARAVGAAAALYWVGTPYLYYVIRQPVMAHVIGAFWVALAVAAFVAVRRRWSDGRSAAAPTAIFGAAAGMAVITRPTNATLIVFAACLAWIGLVRPRGRRRWEALAMGAGALPLIAQALVWKQLNGSFLHSSYRVAFDWSHPKLLQTLLSSRHGLFFWSPLLVLALIGLVTPEARRQVVVKLGLVALVALWIVNSACVIWWFGSAFGARAFLDPALFFIVGLAYYLDRRARAGARSLSRAGAIAAACLLFSWTLMILFMLKLLPDNNYLLPWF